MLLHFTKSMYNICGYRAHLYVHFFMKFSAKAIENLANFEHLSLKNGLS